MINKDIQRTIGTIIVLMLLCLTTFLTGCTDNDDIETINISGIGVNQTIDQKGPIKLVVSGSDHSVTISKDTEVKEIIMSGTDNTVYLPSNKNPKTTISGTNCVIVRT